jgi:hypothetical protein
MSVLFKVSEYVPGLKASNGNSNSDTALLEGEVFNQNKATDKGQLVATYGGTIIGAAMMEKGETAYEGMQKLAAAIDAGDGYEAHAKHLRGGAGQIELYAEPQNYVEFQNLIEELYGDDVSVALQSNGPGMKLRVWISATLRDGDTLTRQGAAMKADVEEMATRLGFTTDVAVSEKWTPRQYADYIQNFYGSAIDQPIVGYNDAGVLMVWVRADADKVEMLEDLAHMQGVRVSVKVRE